ncbi:MAG: hypothetical protein ACOCVR_04415 [Myxococcota bacterium]
MSDKSKSVDPKITERITPELVGRVREKAHDGRITCAMLRRVADELELPYRVAGAAADAAGVKVHGCQLGCF